MTSLKLALQFLKQNSDWKVASATFRHGSVSRIKKGLLKILKILFTSPPFVLGIWIFLYFLSPPVSILAGDVDKKKPKHERKIGFVEYLQKKEHFAIENWPIDWLLKNESVSAKITKKVWNSN